MKKSWVRAHKSTLDSCCKRILDFISYKKKLHIYELKQKPLKENHRVTK